MGKTFISLYKIYSLQNIYTQCVIMTNCSPYHPNAEVMYPNWSLYQYRTYAVYLLSSVPTQHVTVSRTHLDLVP